jgi:hypothetical protein
MTRLAINARLYEEVKDLFRNEKTTEFVIVTIPTVLGGSVQVESTK